MGRQGVGREGMGRAEAAVWGGLLAHAAVWLVVRGALLSARFDDPGGDPVRFRAVARGLRPGWLFGRRVDLSDAQWAAFRGAAAPLGGALLAFAGLGLVAERLAERRAGSGGPPANCSRLRGWPAAGRLVASLGFLGFAHGAQAAWPLLLASLAFLAAKAASRLPPRAAEAAVWLFSLGTLAAARATPGLLPAGVGALGRGATRWEVCYNLVVLRQISFGLDWLWARRPPAAAPPGPAPAPPARLLPPDEADYRRRTEGSAAPAEYGYAAFLQYVFYPPLYVAGPVMSFNAFAAYLKRRQRVLGPRAVAAYALRLAALALVLEVFTHTLYMSSMTTGRVYQRFRGSATYGIQPPELVAVSFLVLAFMWFKFAVIWRFARLFALLDGVLPPENMRRFFANNHDVEGFWKGWHASFNLWLVRYLYLPLGGRRTKLANVWVVFTFVALWHDVDRRLLGWAWVMCLFLVPETVVKWWFAKPWADRYRGTFAYRQARAAAASLYIMVLLVGNLIGFQIGLDGAAQFLRDIFGHNVGLCLGVASFVLPTAHFQFEWRRLEALEARRAWEARAESPKGV